MTDKCQLRAAVKARRNAFVAGLTVAERARCHGVMPSPLARLIGPETTIAGYCAMGSEADPLPLLRAASVRGAHTALVWTGGHVQPLRFVRWTPDDPLLPGPFGLRQPAADGTDCDPDVILVPLVAFDRQLNRLGQGAGFYDRTLARFPAAIAIGLAWSVQEVERVPTDIWDVPLDAILTEKEWICR